MQNETYTDGIAEITVTGPIVRIDLMSLSPTERDANNNPKPVFRQRLVMPVDAFANSVELMQKAVSGLIEAGAIQPVPAVSSKAADTRQETTPASQGSGVGNFSPNFAS